MVGDFLTNKWILSGVGFLIVFTVACMMWYHYDTAPVKKQAAKTAEIVLQSERELSNTESSAETVSLQVPTNSIPSTTKKSITETPVTKDTEPTQAQTEVLAKTTETTDVPVSPNGFGPYPQIPTEMGVPKDKVKIFWKNVSVNPRHELLFRVRIKLYQQGIKATGATYERNGLIYPIIKGIRYVEWDTVEYPDGTVERYVSGSTGHPDDNFMRGVEGLVFESDIPTHLKIYNYPDGGIDPYKFLDLSKE